MNGQWLITQQTASIIWHCYREIEVAEELLKEIHKGHYAGKNPESISETFDRQANFQLGVPTCSSGHRLYHLKPELAERIIQAHIESKKEELVKAMVTAERELGLTKGSSVLPSPPEFVDPRTIKVMNPRKDGDA
jgi:hypothetical protein